MRLLIARDHAIFARDMSTHREIYRPAQADLSGRTRFISVSQARVRMEIDTIQKPIGQFHLCDIPKERDCERSDALCLQYTMVS